MPGALLVYEPLHAAGPIDAGCDVAQMTVCRRNGVQPGAGGLVMAVQRWGRVT